MIAESLRFLARSRCIGFVWMRLAALGFAGSMVLSCTTASVTPDARAIRDASDTGAKVAPATTVERQVLERLEDLPPDQPRNMRATTVVAGRGYHAASGRFCRSVTFSSKNAQPATRLACRETKEWFFVPDVLAASEGPRTALPVDRGPASGP